MPIDEPFEFLSFGGTFGRAFQIWFDRLDFFSAIAGAVIVPFAVLTISMGLLVAIWVIEEEEIPDFHPKHIPLILFVFGLEFMIYELSTILGRAAIMKGVAKMYVGQPVTITECLMDAWAKKFPLLAVSFMSGIGFSIGISIIAFFVLIAVEMLNAFTVTLAVIVAAAVLSIGLYFFVGIALANPSIMIENFSGPVQGLKRSWELATGSRCYLLCILFCLWFLHDLIKRLLTSMFLPGDEVIASLSFAGLFVLILPILVYFPLHSIMETVMYLNLRIGRESMNHQVLSGDLMSDGATNASRFRQDDYIGPNIATTLTNYRHVPLVDQQESLLMEKEMI